MKFGWPLLLIMKFTRLFLNMAKIHIVVPKCIKEGRGGGRSTGLGNVPKKKTSFLTAFLSGFRFLRFFLFLMMISFMSHKRMDYDDDDDDVEEEEFLC